MSRGKFKAVFLDFYGTVAGGDAQAVESVCARIVADLGLNMTAQKLCVDWGNVFFSTIDRCNHDNFRTLYQCECDSLIETLKPTYGSVDPIPYADLLHAYWCKPALQPEARDVMRTLGLPICCVSNADTDHLHAAIEAHDLPFDGIVSSEQARCYKPDRAIFDRAMELMDVKPDEVLHVGDSLHSDIGGANALGIASAWICRDQRIHDVGDATPDHRIESLSDIAAIIQ
jgi:2-haloalkanoic acid dehalogenase type II